MQKTNGNIELSPNWEKVHALLTRPFMYKEARYEALFTLLKGFEGEERVGAMTDLILLHGIEPDEGRHDRTKPTMTDADKASLTMGLMGDMLGVVEKALSRESDDTDESMAPSEMLDGTTYLPCRHFHSNKPAHEVAKNLLEQIDGLEKHGQGAQAFFLMQTLRMPSHTPYVPETDFAGMVDADEANMLNNQAPAFVARTMGVVKRGDSREIAQFLADEVSQLEPKLRQSITWLVVMNVVEKAKKGRDVMEGVMSVPEGMDIEDLLRIMRRG